MKKNIISILLFIPVFSIAAPKVERISDATMKRYIIEGNKVEQCLFPRLSDANRLSEVDKLLHTHFVYEIPLINTIGEQKAHKIFSNPKSHKNFVNQFNRLNHSEPAQFSQEWCETVQKQYAEELPKATQWLAQYKRQQEQAFYQTPQGQAYLAQQNLLQQQQALQYQQQMLEQQRIQQEQIARQQAWQGLANTIQQSAQSLTNTLNNNTQMLNNMTNRMRMNNQMMMQNWGNRGGSINCYNFGSITRCNY